MAGIAAQAPSDMDSAFARLGGVLLFLFLPAVFQMAAWAIVEDFAIGPISVARKLCDIVGTAYFGFQGKGAAQPCGAERDESFVGQGSGN